MVTLFRAAAVQMNSGEDKQANLQRAEALVERAAAAGAQLVALPELFNCLGRPEVMLAQAEPLQGPTLAALSAWAGRLGVTLLGGSFCQRDPASDKAFNTSCLIGPDGQLLAVYRKMHLFDIDLPGRVTFQESRWLARGDCVAVTQTPLGRLGQAICYDLRFSPLFNRLADLGAELIGIPSAFTMATGRDHWLVLLRARAIENQAYVVAPNQCGQHTPHLVTYGRSAIIDPWGVPLAVAPDGEAVIVAEIDRAHQREIRQQLPSLAHRRAIP